MDRLGGTAPVPVEIVPFGWETTSARLAKLGATPALRRTSAGEPFRTDGGNLIVDCHVGPISDPAALDQAIGQTIGVVETGLFIAMAKQAFVAVDQSVREITRSS